MYQVTVYNLSWISAVLRVKIMGERIVQILLKIL
jgi:hypothetical protein